MTNNSNIEIWLNNHCAGVEFIKAEYKTCTFTQHIHHEFVIAVAEEGSGSFSCRGGAGVATAGKIILLPPNEPHFAHVDEAWKYRAFYLNEEAIDALAVAIGCPPQAIFGLPQGVLDDLPLARALLANHRLWEEGGDPAEAESQFVDCLVQLLKHHASMKPRRNSRGERRRVAAAYDLMADNCQRDLSVSELSDVAGMSKFHFIRTFKAEYGMPPHAYLNQLRLMAAKQMLARGESVAAAALAVGLYDQSHLHKLFKRSYGITPSQYARARARAGFAAEAARVEAKSPAVLAI